MADVNTRGFLRTIVTGEQREGVCRECDVTLVKELYRDGSFLYPNGKDKAPVERVRTRMACPKCGGMGRLVVRTYSIQPPPPPQCLSINCLYQFFKDTLFCALLSNYHSRRVAYATRNRHKKILERYRTGEPSPETIWQAIHANIKLKCPVCRKYNVDPFLGGR